MSPHTHTIGGTVTGTNLAGLVLQNNGGDNLAINSAGAFTFASSLAAGASYNVTILSSPSGQSCVVTNGSGTMPSSNVTNVSVVCTVNTYALGGSLQNLAGSGLKLTLTADNVPGESVFPAAGATSFSFATPVAAGAHWAITVDQQPADPFQTCTATPSSGTMPAGDVSDIVVGCTTNTYTIGGTASGDNLAGLVLQNNGGDNLAVNSAGAFTFASPLENGASYNVTILSSPVGYSCLVTNGAGTMPNSNVTNVEVECTANTYALGGSVQNLIGSGLTLILSVDNGPGESVFPAAGATSFSFATPVPTGAQWSIAVDHQPANPYQTCTATPSSGTMPAGDVSDIVVNCTTNAYTIGGTASGIDASGLVLQLNGGNDLSVSASGPFTFAASVDSGATYTVTILSQPAGRSCTLGNASGTVAGNNVTDVSVSCIALPQLALSVSDGSDFARYGQIVDYAVTLDNNGDGDATDVAVTFTLSAGFDGAFAQFACYGADGGATCTQDAGNPLLYHVALPAHRTLTWLISVPVRSDTPEATVEFDVAANGAASVSDTRTLVIFRDGFDVPYGDGMQSVPVVEGAAARAILDGNALREVAIPDAPSATTTTLLIVRDDARDVRVDHRDAIGLDLVRLHARDADGRERATPWSVTRAGATLEFGSEAATDAGNALGDDATIRNLVLVGASPALSLRR